MGTWVHTCRLCQCTPKPHTHVQLSQASTWAQVGRAYLFEHGVEQLEGELMHAGPRAPLPLGRRYACQRVLDFDHQCALRGVEFSLWPRCRHSRPGGSSVCMYVCVYVCVYACMHVVLEYMCSHALINVDMGTFSPYHDIFAYIRMHTHTHSYIHDCTYKQSACSNTRELEHVTVLPLQA
jgi:hypothetical protein